MIEQPNFVMLQETKFKLKSLEIIFKKLWPSSRQVVNDIVGIVGDNHLEPFQNPGK